MRTHTLHKQKPFSTAEQLQWVREAVANGNNGYADFPPLDSYTYSQLREAGYVIRNHDRIFIGGVRIYSPDYSPEPAIPEQRQASDNLIFGDVEGAILARQSNLISTI